jgi:hypothetical protein
LSDAVKYPAGARPSKCIIITIEPEQPKTRKRAAKATTAAKRPRVKPKPVVIEQEPPKPKKKTLLFVSGRKVEVEDSQIVEDVARREGIRCPILLQDAKGSSKEDWWVASDSSDWFKDGEIQEDMIQCKVLDTVWRIPSPRLLSQRDAEECIRRKFHVTADEVLIT